MFTGCTMTYLSQRELDTLTAIQRRHNEEIEEYQRQIELEELRANKDPKEKKNRIAPPPHALIVYSDKYYDDKYEYRHVSLPSVCIRNFIHLF